jgi:hypothetical protein
MDARLRLQQLLPPGQRVTVTGSEAPRRADIQKRGHSINRAMVRSGHARTIRTGGELGRRLRRDQANARWYGRGLWAACEAIPPDPAALPCVPVRTWCLGPEEAAEECSDVALAATPAIEDLPGQKMRGAASLRFRVYDGRVTTRATNDGPPCDYYGYRTLKMWMEMENDAGRMRRNSAYLTLVRGNQEVDNEIFRLDLFTPYTCNGAPIGRRWRIKFREISSYGPLTRGHTVRIKDIGFHLGFLRRSRLC